MKATFHEAGDTEPTTTSRKRTFSASSDIDEPQAKKIRTDNDAEDNRVMEFLNRL